MDTPLPTESPVPMHGLHVKTQEARIEVLEQQNFDLKLRIYHLEKQLSDNGLGHLVTTPFDFESSLRSEISELRSAVAKRDDALRKSKTYIDALRSDLSRVQARLKRTTNKETELESMLLELQAEANTTREFADARTEELRMLTKQKYEKASLIQETTAVLDMLERRCEQAEAKSQQADRQVTILESEVISRDKLIDRLESELRRREQYTSPGGGDAELSRALQDTRLEMKNLKIRLDRMAESNRLLIFELEEKRTIAEFAKAEYDKLLRLYTSVAGHKSASTFYSTRDKMSPHSVSPQNGPRN
eukprot:c29070_g1_i1.p1 GENE.c29070_g1_i1~~c29070_g1_i1.p1  ORF type:complete len:304 (+),score=62.69 c29070_g1_i1:33-944(+)